MTLGEFREQTRGMSDDLVLEIYTERFNDSTQPIRLEFDTEGYIEFIIDDDRWDLKGEIEKPKLCGNCKHFGTTNCSESFREPTQGDIACAWCYKESEEV